MTENKAVRIYTPSQVSEFARTMKEVANAVRESNPDLVLYTIRGAVPIADCLRIADHSIQSLESDYLPASSVIVNRTEVIYSWFKNMLEDTHIRGQEQKIITIDESISGSSVIATTRQIRRAVMDYCNDNDIDPKEINYHSICIEDNRPKLGSKARNSPFHKTYLDLKEMGIVKAIPTKENLVMDNPELCPVELQKIPDHKYGSCLPIMVKYVQSDAYLSFLERLGSEIGQDVSTVDFQNPTSIKRSERYLPKKYHSLEDYLGKK